MEEKIIRKLIKIGQRNNLKDLTEEFSIQEIKKYEYITKEHWGKWYDLSEKLTIEEIVALMKAFTIAEKSLPGWNAGSVSPVIWLYKKYTERKPKDIEDITNWIIENTDNPWAPFSLKLGAKSLKEVEERRKIYYEEKEKKEREENYKKEIKLKRKYSNRIKNIEKQKIRKAERNEVIKRIEGMPKEKRLEFIAKNEYPLDFYKSEYGDIEDEILKKLSKETKDILIRKIGDREKGTWMRLKKNILKVDGCNSAW